MARHATWAALAVAAGLIVGCGAGKELPNATPKGPNDDAPAAVVPAASEPAAKAYIETAVKAYTGGKPELVAKGKASRLILTGTRAHPVDNELVPVPTTRTAVAVWPDRFHALDELQLRGDKETFSAWLLRPRLTMMKGNQEYALPNAAESELNLAADETAQHWMALFLPVTDPKAVVFDLQKLTFNQQPAQALKLSLGAFPVYRLYFDAKSDALLRVEYTVTEQGARRRKQWSMAEHKPGPEGLLLPGKMECRHDNVVVEEWETAKWEFPAAIADTEFSPPKK